MCKLHYQLLLVMGTALIYKLFNLIFLYFVIHKVTHFIPPSLKHIAIDGNVEHF